MVARYVTPATGRPLITELKKKHWPMPEICNIHGETIGKYLRDNGLTKDVEQFKKLGAGLRRTVRRAPEQVERLPSVLEGAAAEQVHPETGFMEQETQ